MPRKPTQSPTVIIKPRDDGTVEAVEQRYTWRCLMEDGTTIDVVAPRLDSNIRAALVDHFGVAFGGVDYSVCLGEYEYVAEGEHHIYPRKEATQ